MVSSQFHGKNHTHLLYYTCPFFATVFRKKSKKLSGEFLNCEKCSDMNFHVRKTTCFKGFK